MAVKAQVEKLLPPPAASFLYKTRREHFGVYWHFHPEYQLTLVTRGATSAGGVLRKKDS